MPSTHHGILVHIVFSTKNRARLIESQWEESLYSYIGGIVRDHKATLLCIGGVQDHVHLFVRLHPSYAIADTVQLIKSNSSRWINEERKCQYRFQWQRGYGVFSVSQSKSEMVKQYIRNQKSHHTRQTFVREYLDILRLHQIEFDERYVFDDEIVG